MTAATYTRKSPKKDLLKILEKNPPNLYEILSDAEIIKDKELNESAVSAALSNKVILQRIDKMKSKELRSLYIYLEDMGVFKELQ